MAEHLPIKLLVFLIISIGLTPIQMYLDVPLLSSWVFILLGMYAINIYNYLYELLLRIFVDE